MCWVLNHHKIICCKFNWTILALIFISRSHILRMYHLFLQPEPEFRPPMSEVVQQLVRLMQRASIVRRQSGEELGFSYRAPEREGDLRDISFWVRSKYFHDTTAKQLQGSICLGKIWNVHMNWRSWADDENSEPEEFEKIILYLLIKLVHSSMFLSFYSHCTAAGSKLRLKSMAVYSCLLVETKEKKCKLLPAQLFWVLITNLVDLAGAIHIYRINCFGFYPYYGTNLYPLSSF